MHKLFLMYLFLKSLITAFHSNSLAVQIEFSMFNISATLLYFVTILLSGGGGQGVRQINNVHWQIFKQNRKKFYRI